MDKIKIMSWNIFWGLGGVNGCLDHTLRVLRYINSDTRENIEKIAKYVKSHKIDVLGLQEADHGSRRNRRLNQVKKLSSMTGLRYHGYAPEKNFIKYSDDGNALLSRTRFLEIKAIELPFNLEKRNFICAKLKIHGKLFRIFTTHLGAWVFNNGERKLQAKKISENVKSSGMPTILMGDFNCGPDDSEFKEIEAGSGLIPVIRKNTYNAYGKGYMYDNILVSKNIKVMASGVFNINLSDHYPVYAEIKIK